RRKRPGKYGLKNEEMGGVDFSDTKIAFAGKTGRELRHAARLFRLINRPVLVRMLSRAAIFAVKMRLPFTDRIIRRTIYEQFVGGESLKEVEAVIGKLYDQGCQVVLDFAVEGKNEEHELDA